MLGILLIDKELGCTSHDVVNDIRRKFGTKRVGHAGTLDPLATGLLVIAVGPATRFLQYLPLEPKEYLAEIRFGRATTTFDAEGQTTFEGEVPDDLPSAIAEALPRFKGLIQQLPPMYSAVKVNGQPLYKYARRGEDLVREPRTVHIEEFEIQKVDGNTAFARTVCSGGTYIRSLAHDLGECVGCGAYLTALSRTKVGRFELKDAVKFEDATPARLISLKEALPPMPLIELDETLVAHVREGRAINLEEAPDGPMAGLLEDGEVFSVARVHGNLLQPECVIPSGVKHGAV